MIEKTKSIYIKEFDRNSPFWTGDAKNNELFLKGTERFFNDIFLIDGYVFLRDVLEKLGIPIDSTSIIVGWFYDPNNKFVDNYIDFRIEQIGSSPNFVLDFNVDGDILHHFNHKVEP